MNAFGKALVLVHTSFSLLALAFAGMLFLQFTDFGWVQPRKEYETRVPSEIDKRVAALSQAYTVRNREVARLRPDPKTAGPDAQEKLYLVMSNVTPNRQFYDKELITLKKGTDPIEVKSLTFKDGMAEPDIARVGKPQFGPPLETPDKRKVTKTLETIRKELADLTEKHKELTKDTMRLIDANIALTVKLAGDKDRNLRGLYEILEEESLLQRRLKKELDEIRPKWADALREVAIFNDRRDSLETTIYRLKQFYKEVSEKEEKK
jgi:methyl-accepting chemotaxis protein